VLIDLMTPEQKQKTLEKWIRSYTW